MSILTAGAQISFGTSTRGVVTSVLGSVVTYKYFKDTSTPHLSSSSFDASRLTSQQRRTYRVMDHRWINQHQKTWILREGTIPDSCINELVTPFAKVDRAANKRILWVNDLNDVTLDKYRQFYQFRDRNDKQERTEETVEETGAVTVPEVAIAPVSDNPLSPFNNLCLSASQEELAQKAHDDGQYILKIDDDQDPGCIPNWDEFKPLSPLPIQAITSNFFPSPPPKHHRNSVILPPAPTLFRVPIPSSTKIRGCPGPMPRKVVGNWRDEAHQRAAPYHPRSASHDSTLHRFMAYCFTTKARLQRGESLPDGHIAALSAFNVILDSVTDDADLNAEYHVHPPACECDECLLFGVVMERADDSV